MENLTISNITIYQPQQIDWGQRRFNNLWTDDFRVRKYEEKHGFCMCWACTTTEAQIQSAKLGMKPLEVKIGQQTLVVKVHIMSGEKAITKVNTVWVCPTQWPWLIESVANLHIHLDAR